MLILGGGVLLSSLILTQGVWAQKSDVVYPVKELGNCRNEEECRSFCDVKDNIIPCVNFAEKQGLMTKEDAAYAKKFAQIGSGPGGCKNQKDCESYCDNVQNIDSCLSFASQNNLMSARELAEAQKVAQALKSGAKLPGSCRNKAECENYCDNTDHAEECLNFAEAANLIPPEELKEAKMAVAAMKAGHKPPGSCRSKKECNAYCQNPDNIEACLNFAEAAGFIPPEELEQVKKIIPLLKAGKMPGGCKTKEDCENFCSSEDNTEACANFALEAGLMKPEEAEIYKKTGGKGPGNCRSQKSCEAYCNDPEHGEECLNFAKDKGLIPPEQLKEMEEGATKFKEGLEQAPPEVTECIGKRIGASKFEKMRTGGLPSKEAGQAMSECFQEVMSKNIPEGVSVPPGGFTKPPTEEEIKKMTPEGVEVSPEMLKKGPPSKEDIQNIIERKTREEMQKYNAPPAGWTPGGSGSVPPAGNSSPPAGGPPSTEDIQKMIPKNIPEGYRPTGF